jgi:hypothetical protein
MQTLLTPWTGDTGSGAVPAEVRLTADDPRRGRERPWAVFAAHGAHPVHAVHAVRENDEEEEPIAANR